MEDFESQVQHYRYLFRGMGFGYTEMTALGTALLKMLRPIPLQDLVDLGGLTLGRSFKMPRLTET